MVVPRNGRRVLAAGPPRRWLLVAAVCVLASSGVLTAAQSATGASAAQVVTPLPPIPPNQDYGAYVDGTATASKIKTKLRLPLSLLRAYLKVAVTPDQRYISTDVDAWVLSPKGQVQQYGIFAPITTSVLAFGAIPVTATVHLSQVLDGKTLQPLKIRGRSANFFPYTTDPVTVSGNLQLRISDVEVDQVPLDVGPNCHTRDPITLDLTGYPKNYSVFTGGPLTGNVDIGAFAGCGTGAQDLDPLFNGLISAKSNPAAMQQGTLGQWTSSDPNAPPGPCSYCLPPSS